MYDNFGWLQFRPELGPPTLVEFLALLGIVVCLIYAGHVIKRIWERNNELVPVPVALLMTLAMYLVFFVLASMLYDRTPVNQKANFLMWSVFALAFPAIYYGRIVVNSGATRVIDHISPFTMRIEEPSEFSEARKLALRRDIDGAVRRYRGYLDNTEGALFEAARLLKAEDRFAEAASLFLEISDRFHGKKLVWAEATYHLAKLKESKLHQSGEAVQLLESIIKRTPDSRFGSLAETELARVQLMHGTGPGAREGFADVGDDVVYAPHPESGARGDNGRRYRGDDADVPVPAVDPFYAAALRHSALDSVGSGDAPNEDVENVDAESDSPAHNPNTGM